MRIFFSSLTLPKKAAKRVQKYFSPEVSHFPAAKLSDAQNVTAVMLGYDSWHELSRVTKKGSQSPSPLDEACSAEEQRQRIDYQTAALNQFTPLIDLVLRQAVVKLRVSAANPLSPLLEEQSFDRNRIVFWTDPFNGRSEWRWFPSDRSDSAWDDISEKYKCWERGLLEGGPFVEELIKRLDAEPENLFVIEHLFYLARNSGQFGIVEDLLDQFEAAVIQTIPSDFPKHGSVYFEWGTHTNRVLHRVTYELAEGYYRIGNFPKAKRWFEFTARTSKHTRIYCLDYLKDLKRAIPCGRVHEVEPPDREFELGI
ncbi:hypothetical protein [Marinobacter salicampi]|uniref:hypothetical protein n=1 Tax=Marinobacter salicampi TaxID=435907 RepID=UPI00140A0937|nr:hypothetical protein [Marinobacter salicampi]